MGNAAPEAQKTQRYRQENVEVYRPPVRMGSDIRSQRMVTKEKSQKSFRVPRREDVACLTVLKDSACQTDAESYHVSKLLLNATRFYFTAQNLIIFLFCGYLILWLQHLKINIPLVKPFVV